jgi:hypothetical protein
MSADALDGEHGGSLELGAMLVVSRVNRMTGS